MGARLRAADAVLQFAVSRSRVDTEAAAGRRGGGRISKPLGRRAVDEFVAGVLDLIHRITRFAVSHKADLCLRPLQKEKKRYARQRSTLENEEKKKVEKNSRFP